MVALIPPEVPEAFGSCRKFRHAPQSVPRSPCAFAVGTPCPRSSNYTPLPVGSLWGCCALWELYSARADLLPVILPEYKKGDFSAVGAGFVTLMLQNGSRVSAAGLSSGRPVYSK